MLADPVHDEPAPLRWLGRLCDLAVMLCGAGIALLVFGNVVSRFVFALDIAAASELVTFLLVWGTFIGGAAAARRRAHMRVGELVGLLGGRARSTAEVLICLIVIGTLLPVIVYGAIVVELQWPQQTTVLYWPQGALYLAMPVGAALTLVFVAHDMWRCFVGLPHPADPPGTA